MASITMAAMFTNLKSVFQKQTGTVRNVVTVLLVFGMQAIVSSEDLFKCPIKDHASYGWMFIIAPGIILFLIALFLNDGFWKIATGCCYQGNRRRISARRRYCPCCFPKWGFSKNLLEVLFYSAVASAIWIFWSFLERKYYTCAKAGNKEARLFNKTIEEKKRIELEFSKASDESQIIAFSLLAIMLGVPFIVLTTYRCCCQRPISSLPSPYEYLKLEAKSAVETFTSKMEGLAKDQGKRKAEMYFSEQIQSDKTPTAILIQAYDDLTKVESYAQVFPALDEYKEMEAKAAVSAFKTQVEGAGKDKVALTFVDKTLGEYEKKNPFRVVENVYESIVERYPRSTGDRSQPYVKMEEQLNEKQVRHDAFAIQMT
ncbi:calcium homeostasis modulator protein 5-like [Actinia tenebrosa]|uniref:Calcium homeostasis modulator protein 5-like n=1 Tax=Actinia tenebrosa TaxID=6105 RepID=A0A6P8IIN2_ACTTE|nr:calcium homeostasis modulator protein 5-like [Actinia tenebrosa]